jgi:hypothetical protein
MQLSVPELRCSANPGDARSALRFVVLAAEAVLIAAAALLAARRAAGALSRPVETPVWLVSGVVLSAGAAALREVWLRAGGDVRRFARLAGYWIPTAPLLAFLVACWLPGTPAAGIGAFIAVAVVEHVWAAARLAGRGEGGGNRGTDGERQAPRVRDARASPAEDAEVVVSDLTRRRAADGSDVIEGRLLAEFAAGSRHAVVYVAFCPPFETTPAIRLAWLDGTPAAVTLTQGLPHGARIELKRSGETETASTTQVAISARGIRSAPHESS